MTALLAYLRKRPWLVPGLIVLGLGVSGMVSDRPWYLLFWASILAAVGGLLMVVTGYLALRRGKGAEDHRKSRQIPARDGPRGEYPTE